MLHTHDSMGALKGIVFNAQSVAQRSVHWHREVSRGSEPSSQGSFNAALKSLESWVADLQAAQLPLDVQCLTALLNVSQCLGMICL